MGIAIWVSALVLIQQVVAQQPQNPVLAGNDPAEAVPRTNPFASDVDLRQGQALFQTHCAHCHGVRGEGGRGADLTAGIYRQGGSDSELYKTIRTGVPRSEMPAVQVSTDETWKMVGFVKRIGSQGLSEKAGGNPRAGKAIYEKSQCAACHRIGSEGQDLGPDLTTIGRRRGLSFLEESILKPDAYIPNNYRAIRIVTKTGATVVGMRLNEDDLSVQMRDMAGNPLSFMKEEIKEIRFNQPSLMRSYQSALNKQELSDLIAYLNSLKEAQ